MLKYDRSIEEIYYSQEDFDIKKITVDALSRLISRFSKENELVAVSNKNKICNLK